MKSIISKGVLAAGLAASLAIASSAYAVVGGNGPNAYGEPIPTNEAEDLIKISPDTKYATVREEDKVQFVDAQTGKSFSWAFDVAGPVNFPLSAFAPAGFPAGQTRVYVKELPEDD